MSARDEDRIWLLRESERSADGWEATCIRLYGTDGALDLLAAQRGAASKVNLSRRPFAGDDEFKRLVREAREAHHALERYAYERMFSDFRAADPTGENNG